MSDPVEEAKPQPAAPQKKDKPFRDVRFSVRIFSDKDKRNRFRLSGLKEITMHRDVKSVVDEIGYYLNQETD